MKVTKALSLVVALLMVVTLAACGGTAPAPSSTPSESTGSTAPAPTAGPKEITINLGSNPPEMNSILTTDSTSGNVLRHVITTLTTLDTADNAQPGVAKSWTISPDGLTYTFDLRDDMKWSNGEPVTAHDFIFAWTQVLTPANAAEYSYMGFAFKNGEKFFKGECGIEEVGFKAEGDYKLVVTLENPIPYFLSQLAFYTFAPVNEKTFNEMGGFEKYGKEANQMVYNGPYVMTEWKHEDKIVLEKNPNYYDATNVDIDKITMMMIKDSNAALNAFLAGDLDMVGVTGTQRDTVAANGIELKHYSDGSSWYLEYNTAKSKPLQNKKIRQALTLAIDAESFTKNVVKNDSIPAYSFTNPAITGADGKPFSDSVGKLINRDIATAKKLLEEGMKEAGVTIADMNKLVYITDDTDTAATHAAFFQNQWKTNLGVEIQVEQMPFKSRLERMTNKDFDIVMAGWGPDYNDPMTFMDLWVKDGGNNHTSWSNARYDEIIKLCSSEPDPMKRQELFIEAEKILADECPVGIIYNRMRDFVTSDGLTGVYRSPFQDINLIGAKFAK